MHIVSWLCLISSILISNISIPIYKYFKEATPMSPVSVVTVRVRSEFHIIIWGRFNWPGARGCCVIDVTGAASTVTSHGPDSAVRAPMTDIRKRPGEEPSAAERQHHLGKKPAASRWFRHFWRHFSAEPVEMTPAVFAAEADLGIGVNVAVCDASCLNCWVPCG